MPCSSVKMSYSMTELEALTRHYRLPDDRNFTTPFDISAAVGYGDKKSFFKTQTPRENVNNHRIVTSYSVRKFASLCFSCLKPVYTGDFCRSNSMQLNAIFVAPKLQPAALSLRF